jgi:hypothetical protein
MIWHGVPGFGARVQGGEEERAGILDDEASVPMIE